MIDVICVGAANLDTIAVVPHALGPDQRVISESILQSGGGPAATAAVALARQGASVGFCGLLGDDEAGHTLDVLLRAAGVDTSWCRFLPTVTTARSVVLIETATGTRSIAAGIASPPRPEDVPLDASRWLHVDQVGYRPVARATRRTPAPRVSVDGGNPIADLSLERVDLYAPTVASLLARSDTDDIETALRASLTEGAGQVVATDGANGTYLIHDGEFVHVPAFGVDVVSTLGAGDVFHGALLARVASGEPLDRAVRHANATAALSCRGIDGTSTIPTREQTDAFASASSIDHHPPRETL